MSSGRTGSRANWLIESDRVGRARLSLTVAIVVGLVCSALSGLGFLDDFTGRLSDAGYPVGRVDPRILVVELPVAALDWDRGRHADLIDALAAGGAEVIAYDVVFDAERPGPGTEALADALSRAGNVLLASSGGFVDDGSLGLSVVNQTDPTPRLAAASAGVAHAAVVATEQDARIRSVPTTARLPGGDFRPALSYQAANLAEGGSTGTSNFPGPNGVMRLGASRAIPTSGLDAGFLVNWAWRWTSDRTQYPVPDMVVGWERVVEDRVDLKGRVVFVGVASTLVDFFPTPVNPTAMPGVHIHASAANSMLTGEFRSSPKLISVLAFIWVMAALVAGAGVMFRLIWLPPLVVGLMAVWYARWRYSFDVGLTLDPFWPYIAALSSGVGVVAARYDRQRRERERVSGLFGQYVPEAVVQELLSSGHVDDAASGQRVEVTVLFADLRGFTAIAATLEPADVRALLEVYYDHSTRIIHEHGGTIMQFVGDEVFAVFGAPLHQRDHAQRAVDAARAMKAAHDAVNAELAPRGIEIAWGIGLNTGEVVAAHVGSEFHKQYAVVGQAVNVGARLCSQAGPREIVLSRWTIEALAEQPEVEWLGPVALKGVLRNPDPARLLG